MDLERLFRQLVLKLSSTDPGRLSQPISLAEIRDSILPYRANRRALQLETSEDYELALLRLCAGQDDLAQIDPAELEAEFVTQAASSNPDLEILIRHATAQLHLDQEAVSRILHPEPDLRFAPRPVDIQPVSRTPRRPARSKPATPPEPALARCSRCRESLPPGRVIKYCPHCGHNLSRRHCTQCGIELESDWKHCVECGVAVPGTGTHGRRR